MHLEPILRFDLSRDPTICSINILLQINSLDVLHIHICMYTFIHYRAIVYYVYVYRAIVYYVYVYRAHCVLCLCVQGNCVLCLCVQGNCVLCLCVQGNCVLCLCVQGNCVLCLCVQGNCVLCLCVQGNCVLYLCVQGNCVLCLCVQGNCVLCLCVHCTLHSTLYIVYPNHRRNSFAWHNYIASNLQNSQVEVCFCALRNTPVYLAKVHYLNTFPTHCTMYNIHPYIPNFLHL